MFHNLHKGHISLSCDPQSGAGRTSEGSQAFISFDRENELLFRQAGGLDERTQCPILAVENRHPSLLVHHSGRIDAGKVAGFNEQRGLGSESA
jgi:hypothetical protein